MSFIDLENHVAFVHVWRTGGSTIEACWQHQTSRRIVFAAHESAMTMREMFPAEWERCFKVGFVRNPWSWWVSIFFHYGFCERYPTFREFMLDWEAAIRASRFPLRDQWHMICDLDGKPLVDLVGRYRTLSEDFAVMCGYGPHKYLEFPRINGTRHCDYRRYYDDDTAEIVRKLAARDIELFGFTFEVGDTRE